MDPIEEFLVKIPLLRYFCFDKSSVLFDNRQIPFDILFVNTFKASFTFHLLFMTLNFFNILAMLVVELSSHHV